MADLMAADWDAMSVVLTDFSSVDEKGSLMAS